MGRQKLKKSFQYEIKWRGLDHKFNTWIPREELLEKGFQKIVSQFDDLEASREGAGQRETSAHVVRKHLEDIGLDGDIAQYNEIAGLSGGKPEIVTLLNSRLAVTSFGSQVRRLSSLSLRVYGITPRYVSLRIHRYPGRLRWRKICVLDEPSNFLDREALGGLAVAIRDWGGAVVRLHFPFSSTVI